eukprot:5620331-Prymnesium_polylepis.2
MSGAHRAGVGSSGSHSPPLEVLDPMACVGDSGWPDFSSAVLSFMQQEHDAVPAFNAYLAVLTLAAALNFGGNYLIRQRALERVGLPPVAADKDLDVAVFAPPDDGEMVPRLERMRMHMERHNLTVHEAGILHTRERCAEFARHVGIYSCASPTTWWLSELVLSEEDAAARFGVHRTHALPRRIYFLGFLHRDGWTPDVDVFYFDRPLPRHPHATVLWEESRWPMPANPQVLMRMYAIYTIEVRRDTERQDWPYLMRACLPVPRFNGTLCDNHRVPADCPEVLAVTTKSCANMLLERDRQQRSIDLQLGRGDGWSPHTCPGCPRTDCSAAVVGDS